MDNSNEVFIVRRLSQNEIPMALELAWKVFSEFVGLIISKTGRYSVRLYFP